MKEHVNNIFKSFTSQKQNQEAKDAFHAWLVNSNHEKEKEVQLKEIWEEEPNIPIHDTWSALYRIKEIFKINKQKKFIRLWQSVAALFVLTSSALLYFMLNNSANLNTDIIEMSTPVAQLNTVTLPDGTIVHSNSKSILLYPAEFKGKTRSVYLVGEAMFKVAKDAKHPFIVKTANINVTALGTEFNVAAYPEDPAVYTTLLTGSIKVEDTKSNDSRILIPNEQLAYYKDTNSTELTTIEPEVITAWMDGEIHIQNKTLKEIFVILERHYDVSFHYDWKSLNKEDRYNFKFMRDTPFKEVAKVIKTVSNIQYRIEDNICYIY